MQHQFQEDLSIADALEMQPKEQIWEDKVAELQQLLRHDGRKHADQEEEAPSPAGVLELMKHGVAGVDGGRHKTEPDQFAPPQHFPPQIEC